MLCEGMCREITLIMISIKRKPRFRESDDFPKVAQLIAEPGFDGSSA